MGRSGKRMLSGQTPKEAKADPHSLQQRGRKAVHHQRPTSSPDSRRKSRAEHSHQAAGCRGNPAGGSDLTSFLFPSRIPSAPDCRTSRAPAPAHRSGGERQGPSPAPAPPAAGVRAAASPEAPERPAASPRPAPGQEAPLPRPLHRRRAHPAHSHLRAYVRHEGGLGRLGAATTADSPFPQHPAALRSNDARRQRRRLRLRFRQRRRPPAPAAGAPPIPRAAAAAVPPASGSAADTVRSAQATRPAYRPWDTPTSARSSQAEVPPTEREPATPSPLLAPVPERPPLLAGFAAKPAPRHPLIGTGQCLKRYLL